MVTTVQHKRSEVVGSEPESSDILVGELAVNLADGKLFSKKDDGTVVTLAGNVTATTYYIPSSFGYITETADFGTDFGLITSSVGNGNTQETNTDSDVTFDSLTTTNKVTVSYAPASATGAAIEISAKDTQGGTGLADFLKVSNTTTGATNPNKWFRLTSTGAIEIINSAYSASLLYLTESGDFSVKNSISVNGKIAVNGPAFSVHQNTAQSVPTDVQTKLIWHAEEYDTNGNFASNKFTPTVEGYYALTAAVRFDSGIGTGERMIVIYKNGSEYKRAYNTKGSAAVGDSWMQMEINCQVYANGSTDYFEVYAQHGAGGNRSTTGGAAFTYFQGCMIRGA